MKNSVPAVLNLSRLAFGLFLGFGASGAALAQSTYTPYAITTLAGSAGFNGSRDQTGALARFSYPAGVVVDGAGNLYVADGSNGTVRLVTAAGVVTTFAGQAGATGTADGTGTSAKFGTLGGIAIDASGTLYVTDSANGAVRKITTPGAVVTTIAATVGQLNQPAGIAVDASGNIYVADAGNAVIRKITPGGVMTTLAGQVGNSGFANGTGTAAQFAYPLGLAVDASGNVYTTDASLDIIRKITPGGVVTTWAGTVSTQGAVDGALASALFNHPNGIAFDSAGNAYVMDGNTMLRRISVSGAVTSLAGAVGSGGSRDGTGSTAQFSFSFPSPSGLAVTGSGTIYLTDTGNNTIRAGVSSAATPPAVQTQPLSQIVSAGSTVTLTVVVSGTAPFTYQWTQNGTAAANGVVASSGANSSFTLANVSAGDAGNYQVTVSNPGGAVTTSIAVLVVTPVRTAASGRLVNLSVLSKIRSSLSMGFVIGGSGTAGSENVLIRATGPTLAAPPFNVPGVLIDPKLTVVQQAGATVVATNSGWGTPLSNRNLVTSTDAAVGAFALNDPTSLDSALVTSLPISVGGYTATVAGTSGDSGYALAEVYDATPASSYTLATARLVNLSCLTQLAAGDTLTTGFVITGSTAETLLIRATGPALALPPFNIPGVVPDPKLSVQPLSDATNIVATNSAWAAGGNAGLINLVDSGVGAFALTDSTSLDSAVVVTLQPNVPYTVQATSASGVGGYMLVEIYEVR